MKTTMKQIITYWGHLLPYARVPHNDSEYEKLLDLVDVLMEISRQKQDERVTSFLKFVAKNIEAYEKRHYLTPSLSPIDMLEFLMEEHSLGQDDLPEIGSQSLVSKILSGDRQLTVEHIRHLAKRFGVSPSVFC